MSLPARARRFPVKVNDWFRLSVEYGRAYLPLRRGAVQDGCRDMIQNWRISNFNGALLACYFIPAWTIAAFRIMISPLQGVYERPNLALVLFVSDHLHWGTMSTVRYAWLMALGKLTVVAFFAVFLVFATRASIRRSGGCDEALSMALGLGGFISFASMVMASKVGQVDALQLHATELLLLLGTVVLMAFEPPQLRVTQSEKPVQPVRNGAFYGLSSPSS
jgi:hypothetical protein